MSDLFCAATVIAARHAEAEYDTDITGDHGGSLTRRGREQARALGESLRDRRVAQIWCSDMSRAVQTAEIAASVLGVAVRVRPALREFAVGGFAGEPFTDELFEPVWSAWMRGDLSAGCPGAESGAEVVRRATPVFDELADQFRGETVLVVSHGGTMCLTLPRLARNVPDVWPDSRVVHNAATCELIVDSDGWLLRSWAGRALVED